NYVTRILNQPKVTLIYDDDTYNLSMIQAFENMFRGLGQEIYQKSEINSDINNIDITDREIEIIVNQLSESDPGMIVLAMQADQAEKFLVEMKRNGLQYPIIGSEVIADSQFWERFKKYPEEQANPGFFLDGIYAETPLLLEVSGQKGQQFREEFFEKYNQAPSRLEASSYDAAKVALEAIQRTDISTRSLQQKRQRVRDTLDKINKIEEGIEGVGGQIYFDNRGNAARPLAIGVFENQNFIPAPVQLQPVTDLNRVIDLEQDVEAGRILLVNSKYMHKTQVVYTGLDINEISDLDLTEASYIVDFYLWFRYQGEFDDDNIEFINSANSLKLEEPIAQGIRDGINYKAYRIKAEFKGDFYFQDYPFDHKFLLIKG
ncbi:MAG: ABC transporter substrate-binding protein, partial [Ekhidna sp.]